MADPIAQVRQALTRLSQIPKLSNLCGSSLYHTPPMGPVAQPNFINAVAGFDYAGTPHDLLAETQAIEHAQGRRRSYRWGPRTIDVDILLFGDVHSAEPTLHLPHPGLCERAGRRQLGFHVWR